MFWFWLNKTFIISAIFWLLFLRSYLRGSASWFLSGSRVFRLIFWICCTRVSHIVLMSLIFFVWIIKQRLKTNLVQLFKFHELLNNVGVIIKLISVFSLLSFSYFQFHSLEKVGDTEIDINFYLKIWFVYFWKIHEFELDKRFQIVKYGNHNNSNLIFQIIWLHNHKRFLLLLNKEFNRKFLSLF